MTLQQKERAGVRQHDCAQRTNKYNPCNFLRAGDDVEICTEAEAGVHQMACAVCVRMQRRRKPWLHPDTNGIGGKAVGRGRSRTHRYWSERYRSFRLWHSPGSNAVLH